MRNRQAGRAVESKMGRDDVGVMVAVLAALLAGSGVSADDLEISISSKYEDGEVEVTAVAVNGGEALMEFCGFWWYQIEYVPTTESYEKFEASRKTEVTGAETDSSWSVSVETTADFEQPQSFPVDLAPYDRSLRADADLSLAPGDSVARTVRFGLEKSGYEEWPGWISVEFHFEICDGFEQQNPFDVLIDSRGGGATVMVPVP